MRRLTAKGQAGSRICYRCVLHYTRTFSKEEWNGRSYILNLDITLYNIVQLPYNYISYVIFNTNLLHSVYFCQLLPRHVSASVLGHRQEAALFFRCVQLLCQPTWQKFFIYY